jgi:uncharacterized protein (DUF1778 family)
MARRTAILIRCSQEEANMIRQAAKAERRTISAYILNAVSNRIAARINLLAQQPWRKKP